MATKRRQHNEAATARGVETTRTPTTAPIKSAVLSSWHTHRSLDFPDDQALQLLHLSTRDLRVEVPHVLETDQLCGVQPGVNKCAGTAFVSVQPHGCVTRTRHSQVLVRGELWQCLDAVCVIPSQAYACTHGTSQADVTCRRWPGREHGTVCTHSCAAILAPTPWTRPSSLNPTTRSSWFALSSFLR